MKPKRNTRPKLSTLLKAHGWVFDGFIPNAQSTRVFKHAHYPQSRVTIESDEYQWGMTTWPDCAGQVGDKGKASLIAQLKVEGQWP